MHLDPQAAKSQLSLHLLPTSGHVQPFQTLRQRWQAVVKSTTWPIIVKMIKADIAVTITFGLFLGIDAIRDRTNLGGIFASIAVEFINPSKPYCFIAEDALLGALMCTLSAGWSLLGTYCASRVRDLEEPTQAQPSVCIILVTFLLLGSFALNYARAKLEQANVGGMLSASIMVMSLTRAVTEPQWTPSTPLQFFLPTLAGFLICFLVSLIFWPDNSTHDYVVELVQVLENVNGIVQRQVNGFVGLPVRTGLPQPLTEVQNALDRVLTRLTNKKRSVSRELAFNRLAPRDVAELTRMVKAMRYPVQGIVLSRAMEKNMREVLQHLQDYDQRDPLTRTNTLSRPSPLTHTHRNSTVMDDNDQDIITEKPPAPSAELDTLSWDHYVALMERVRPLCCDLNAACVQAIDELVVRLRVIQRIEPGMENKPFFFAWFRRPKRPPINLDMDPSIPLLRQIQKFDAQRVKGLAHLYNDTRHPRRILFLLLHFQFNLRDYASRVYTLASLVHDIMQTRKSRQWHLPSMSWRRLFWKKSIEETIDYESPNAQLFQYQETLWRTKSQKSGVLNAFDLDSAFSAPLPEPKRSRTTSLVPGESPRTSIKERGVPIWRWKALVLDPVNYHDPGAGFPTSRCQKLFFVLWRFMRRYVYTADAAFALRAVVLVTILSLPAFLESSHAWYDASRGQWSVIVGLIWMGPCVGSNFFGTMVRTIGSFVGAIIALIIWEIGRATVPGLIVTTFFFNLPCWLVYIHGNFWRSAGLFALITITTIIGNAYVFDVTQAGISIYTVTYQRLASVVIGVMAALIISVLPYPHMGRNVLRCRIASTLLDIGALYGTFLTALLESKDAEEVKDSLKLFRTSAATIRRHIAGQRVLLKQSRFEPVLRGVFPDGAYHQILHCMETMVTMILSMEHALARCPVDWRHRLVQGAWRERKQLIASYLTALHLASSALSNKVALPPYIIRPTKARRQLTLRERSLELLSPDRLCEPAYTYYSAYLMNSEQLAVEIELLVSLVRDLVGPDDVCVWLQYRH